MISLRSLEQHLQLVLLLLLLYYLLERLPLRNLALVLLGAKEQEERLIDTLQRRKLRLL